MLVPIIIIPSPTEQQLFDVITYSLNLHKNFKSHEAELSIIIPLVKLMFRKSSYAVNHGYSM